MSARGLFATVRNAPLYSSDGGASLRSLRAESRHVTETDRDITIYRADWVLPVAAPVQPDGGVAVAGRAHPRRRSRAAPRRGVSRRGVRRPRPVDHHARLRQLPQPRRVHVVPRHPRRRRVRRLDHQPGRRQGVADAGRVPRRAPGWAPWRPSRPASPPSPTPATARRRWRRPEPPACAAASTSRSSASTTRASTRPWPTWCGGSTHAQAAAPDHLRRRPRAARAVHRVQPPLPGGVRPGPRARPQGHEPRRGEPGRAHLHPLRLGQVRARLPREDGLGAHARPALRRHAHQVPAAVATCSTATSSPSTASTSPATTSAS